MNFLLNFNFELKKKFILQLQFTDAKDFKLFQLLVKLLRMIKE